MSLIGSRKRPRNSFSDWNNLLKKKFIGDEPNNQNQDSIPNDYNDKDNSSIVILDSDDENYEFNDTNDLMSDVTNNNINTNENNNNNNNNNNDNDDDQSVVILREQQHTYTNDSNFHFGEFNGFQNGYNTDMAIDDEFDDDQDMNMNLNTHHNSQLDPKSIDLNDDLDFDSRTTTHEDDGQLLARLLKNEKLNGSDYTPNQGHNYNHKHYHHPSQGSLNNPHEGTQVGFKKRRTNSLPQLPLSQISYRRVSELIKIGEVKPNLVLPNGQSITTPSSSSAISSTSSSSSNNSSYNHNQNQYPSSTTTSPLSPIPNNQKKKISVTDKDGYYIVQPGEFFANGRFKIICLLGQGTFGKVIKAVDVTSNETVAIKIIRAIPKYREASKIELRILTTLKNADPENLNNCIHLREVLDYENHICIITDLLDISLFEFLEKNKFKPFPGSQIQAIARQLIRSIAFLHDLKLIHTDLKPENILLTNSDFLKFKRNKVLKNPLINVIDFGSAIFNDEYHSELVSTRHYRAPEIVLGVGWSFPCDLWSLGCILMELVTGEALFKTHENLEHLAIMEKLLDERIPMSMIKKIKNNEILKYFKQQDKSFHNHQFILNYPNDRTQSKSIDFVSSLKKLDDLICSKIKLKISINMNESMKKNWEFNHSNNKSLNFETFQFWFYFIDLVKKLLKFDPSQRISAIDAMNHPWWDFGTIDEATKSLL